MSSVYLVDDINEIVAKLDGVRGSLAEKAESMGAVARGVLDAHHGRTPFRKHNNRPPSIEVFSLSLDWYVALEAGSVQRATGIEFGHRYQSRSKNKSGPWGESQGIGALRAAMGAG